MATSKTPLKSPHLACVSIGYIDLLVPAAVGLKVVQLLQDAVLVQQSVDAGGRTYTPGEEVQVEYCAVRPTQLRSPRPSDAPAMPALHHTPLRLGKPDA